VRFRSAVEVLRLGHSYGPEELWKFWIVFQDLLCRFRLALLGVVYLYIVNVQMINCVILVNSDKRA